LVASLMLLGQFD